MTRRKRERTVVSEAGQQKNDVHEMNDLHERLIANDEDALSLLFDMHRDRLWRIVHFRMDARMAGRMDPDDILQDAFLDATKRLHHYSEERQFSPFVWLRMIVGQTLIDAHRRHVQAKQRDAGREALRPAGNFPQATSVSLADFLSAKITSPSQSLVRSEQHSELHQAIETMEPIDQEILALRHFEELSNKEISEVLGIEQKAASIRYVRAVGRLKKVLTNIPDFSDHLQPAPDDDKHKN